MVKILKIWFIIIGSISLFSACLKEELPLPKHKPGNINTVQIEIGYPYKNQVFYNCKNNKIVSSNSRFAWDIGFQSNGNSIKLNTSRAIFLADVKSTKFDSIYSTKNRNWLWDNENGDLKESACKNWMVKTSTGNIYSKNVYILNRSFDVNGKHLGYFKIQFLYEDKIVFKFKYANLDGSNEKTRTIVKNKKVNFTCFSFDNGGKIVNIEPHKNTWDLQFTNYQHKFSNLSLPFVLTQCLGNIYNGVRVAESNDNNFEIISLKDTSKYLFTHNYDEIGYDWKIRNSQDNSFEIDPKKCFIINTPDGFYYKIRFTDFYDKNGTKGYPTFEIQRL